MSYGRTISVDLGFDEAIQATKQALKEQGFGILTEIDVRATLAEKIGADIEPVTILGACNPELAHRALGIEPQIGLLLPCNVVVRRSEGETFVEAIDPSSLVAITGNTDLRPIADEAAQRIDAALDALRNGEA